MTAVCCVTSVITLSSRFAEEQSNGVTGAGPRSSNRQTQSHRIGLACSQRGGRMIGLLLRSVVTSPMAGRAAKQQQR